MRLRCLLFVPGDRPDRMEKALNAGADALILDLEDAVALPAKPAARAAIATFLGRSDRSMPLFVRINPLEGSLAGDDLAAVLPAEPDGIVLPKSESADSVAALASMLGGRGHIKILPIATETPAAVFGLGTYHQVATRLAALTWGAEDLPAAMGAATSREDDGGYTPPYQVARALTLFAAHAAAVPAIETVFPAIRDLEALAAYAARGRRDGFSGMMAIHPAQVPIIMAAFTPTQAELVHARAVAAAFAAHPGVGVLDLDGKMIDAPHHKQALSILQRAAD